MVLDAMHVEVRLSIPKLILFGAIALFTFIATLGIVKKKSSSKESTKEETILSKREEMVVKKLEPVSLTLEEIAPVKEIQPLSKIEIKTPAQSPTVPLNSSISSLEKINDPNAGKDEFPEADRIFQLFTTGPTKLPIVETVTFSSNVPWLKGKAAWIADYASYYNTSRHFIARSLNGKADYFTQRVSNGSRFNVLRKDKKINFYLLIDVTRCKMGFYYIDLDTKERVLLKTYRVGLGRVDSNSVSGVLTPLGKYLLGNKIAIYKPGNMGYFQDQKVEMIQVFGTRWLPFGEELEGATAPAKGYGIHGSPWRYDPQKGILAEARDAIGKYDSDGCIRLNQEDMEELFAIIITKPTYVEIVKDFRDAKLPGIEASSSKR